MLATTIQPDIRSLTREQLTDELLALGEKRFRIDQVWQWLWQKGATAFDHMTNLPKALRQTLAVRYSFYGLEVAHTQRSNDGSIKYGFRLHDGGLIEGVLIPTEKRATACVSSQIGCSLSCKFCATGYLPLQRNLTPYEIFDQVAFLNRASETELGRPLTNIVYMGMGEPLLNYKNVLSSVERLTAEDGLGFSPRRITVSTAGIAKLIKRLGDDGVKFEFALSLHAANDAKRSELMPINDTNTLEALEDALRHFHAKTGTRVTLEYIVFHGINDGVEDARELAAFARTVPTKINLIEYNPIQQADYLNASEARLQRFVAELERRGHIVNLRRSRGKDVDGGCGQLAGKVG